MSDQQFLRNEPESVPSVDEAGDVWRKEIHRHVDRYRTRRGRRLEGAYSMRFPFPPAERAVSLAEPPKAIEFPGSRDPRETVDGHPGDISAASQGEPEIPVFVQQHIAAAVQQMVAAEAIAGSGNPGEISLEPRSEAEPSARKLSPSEMQLAPAALPEWPAAGTQAQDAPGTDTQAEDARPRVAVAPRPNVRRKVIAFPRHLMATPDVAYRLADPVLPEPPRILDVPEELEAVRGTPFLDGLTFDGKAPAQPGLPEQVELPFRPVSIAQRGYAVAIDALLVAAASGIFAATAYHFLPQAPAGKSLLATAAIVPVLLWFVFQYLLLVYGGATPGMRASGIKLLTFGGTTPKMGQRRNRAIGLCLSTASLAMGLLWAFVDVDALCWHDRMSQTYLTSL